MNTPIHDAQGVPWIDWGGDGPWLHFAHANGIPPATYRSLIAPLAEQFHVVSMEARPLWPGSDPTFRGSVIGDRSPRICVPASSGADWAECRRGT